MFELPSSPGRRIPEESNISSAYRRTASVAREDRALHRNTVQSGLVSIMMPAYNAEEYIGAAVESVLEQTYPQWELLVVNDGSTDRTSAAAARYADRRIRIIEKENGGESSARNAALEQSRGEFIAYLDADDAYLPTHLEVAVEYLRNRPDRDAVYTDGLHMDREGKRLRSLSSRRRGPFEGLLFEHLVISSDVFGPPICVVLRHDLIIRHRFRYDPRIVIGPDWDFFMRYCESAQFGYVAEVTCLYRVHKTNITVRVQSSKRDASLALCRKKAIKLPSFKACPPATRTAVFYDLLVDLLRDLPDDQAEITRWNEFISLPLHEQGRLYRLMASRALAAGRTNPLIEDWLHRSRLLNPSDRRAATLDRLHRFTPRLVRWLLRGKALLEGDSRSVSPFADLEERH